MSAHAGRPRLLDTASPSPMTVSGAVRQIAKLPASVEVVAAELTMRLVANGDDELIEMAEGMLARPDLPAMARARLLRGVGRAIITRSTPTALRLGARRLDEAARTFQRAGADAHAGTTRVIAATSAAWPLGRHDAALEQLDAALASSGGSPQSHAATLPYRAFILIDVGRYAEAEAALADLRDVAATSETVERERAAAYACWGAAKMASQRGDADATWAACRAVERSDVPLDTTHGAFFRADAAQLLARVGHEHDAERLLAEAYARDPGTSLLVTTAAFAVAVHAGDPDRAESLLAELDGGRAVEPRDRWRITLLHAHACREAGDPRARSLAAAAFEEAAQLGHPDLPLIREAAVGRALLPLATASSANARDVAATRGARVRLLGTFEVETDGRIVEPSGRPGELLAFVAIQDRQATTEAVIEALWPGTDSARGHERLRTVLARTRRELGDLIERHDGLLRLQPAVDVDVEEFLRLARHARSRAPDREGAALAAVALYQGEAVPSLGIHEWAVEARRHLERQVLAMHDVIAEVAESDGRLDDAIGSLLTSIELDPSEGRYLATARLLAERGQRSQAIKLLIDARAALSTAGIEPSDALTHLERYLQRAPLAGLTGTG